MRHLFNLHINVEPRNKTLQPCTKIIIMKQLNKSFFYARRVKPIRSCEKRFVRANCMPSVLCIMFWQHKNGNACRRARKWKKKNISHRTKRNAYIIGGAVFISFPVFVAFFHHFPRFLHLCSSFTFHSSSFVVASCSSSKQQFMVYRVYNTNLHHIPTESITVIPCHFFSFFAPSLFVHILFVSSMVVRLLCHANELYSP